MSCLLFQAMVSHMSSAVGAFQKNSLQEKRRLGGLDFRKNQLPPKEEKREGKRKKTKCQHIIVERIGCRLVALGQSFSLFIKTGRDRRTIHQDKCWSMVITETKIPGFRNRGAGPFQDALNKLRVASHFYRYYFSVVHYDVKYSFDILFWLGQNCQQ